MDFAVDVAVDCFEFFAVDLSVEYPPAERYGNASTWLNFIEATPRLWRASETHLKHPHTKINLEIHLEIHLQIHPEIHIEIHLEFWAAISDPLILRDPPREGPG